MDLIQAITLQTLQYNLTFTAIHIPGLDNSIVDSLSRFQMDHFRTLAPSAWLPQPLPSLHRQWTSERVSTAIPSCFPCPFHSSHLSSWREALHHLYLHAWLNRSLKPPPTSLRNYPDVLCISLSQHSILWNSQAVLGGSAGPLIGSLTFLLSSLKCIGYKRFWQSLSALLLPSGVTIFPLPWQFSIPFTPTLSLNFLIIWTMLCFGWPSPLRFLGS